MTGSPLVQELSPAPTIPETLESLADWAGLVLFDSALQRGELGRYSFLTADPFETFTIPEAVYDLDPFHDVHAALGPYSSEPVAGLPPFQGGAAGLLSYDLGRCWERLPAPRWNEFDIPACVIGLYDWVLAWDHRQDRCWFISHGFPETTAALRRARGKERWRRIVERMTKPGDAPKTIHRFAPETDRGPINPSAHSLSLLLRPGLLSNFGREEYLVAVQKVIDYIRAGDIFQANLSQRLLAPAGLPPVKQYLRLRQENPAPFAGFFTHDDWAVLSSSPERFLQVDPGERESVSPSMTSSGDSRPSLAEVITRPIKGTRQRRPVPEADLFTRDELRESEKDQAENVMIVDLMRNDLSRVCKPGTIRVPELCSVEAYETVTHLVSEVRGELRDDATFWDLLRATFPGGSITGAPKIRAMEIITEIEQVARGPYCGSLFYLGFDGRADSNILIRTLTCRHGWLQLPAGGGIVAQSLPADEYEETLHKARGMLRAL